MHKKPSFFIDLRGGGNEEPIEDAILNSSGYYKGHIHEIAKLQYKAPRLVMSKHFHVNGQSRYAAEYLVKYRDFKYMFRLFKENFSIVVYKDIQDVIQDWAKLKIAGANEMLCDTSPRREHYDLELPFNGTPSKLDVDRMYYSFICIRDAVLTTYGFDEHLFDTVMAFDASRPGKLSLHLVYGNIFPDYQSMQAFTETFKDLKERLNPEQLQDLNFNMIDFKIYKSGETFRIPGSTGEQEGSTLRQYLYDHPMDDDNQHSKNQEELTVASHHECYGLVTFLVGEFVPTILLERLVYNKPSARRAKMNRDGRNMNDPVALTWGYALELTSNKLGRELSTIDDKQSSEVYINFLRNMIVALLFLSDHEEDGSCVLGEDCQERCLDLDDYKDWSMVLGVCKCYWGDNKYGRAAAWAVTMRTRRGQQDKAKLHDGAFEHEWCRRKPCEYNVTMGIKSKGWAKKALYPTAKLVNRNWCREMENSKPHFDENGSILE